jgi:hypothetical protein
MKIICIIAGVVMFWRIFSRNGHRPGEFREIDLEGQIAYKFSTPVMAGGERVFPFEVNWLVLRSGEVLQENSRIAKGYYFRRRMPLPSYVAEKIRQFEGEGKITYHGDCLKFLASYGQRQKQRRWRDAGNGLSKFP